MKTSDKPEMGKADVEVVLSEFDGKKPLLSAWCEKTKGLVEELLSEGNVRYQSVQARVKTREKLRKKYLDPQKNYKRLDDITDQAGLRVITYYEDEVDRVVELIKKEFQLDPEKSFDKKDDDPNKFGYDALNFVCKYPAERARLFEYRKVSEIWCEIQVTSILRHAWSEIEHPWYDLKDAYPDIIKRRFARMAALLEIAESEFLSLRAIQSDYQKSVDVRVAANVPDLPVDAVSLKSFIEREPLVEHINDEVGKLWGVTVGNTLIDGHLEMLSQVIILAGMTKLEDIRDALEKYRTAIVEYASRCGSFWYPHPEAPIFNKDTCLWIIANLLISSRGVDAFVQSTKAIGTQPTYDVARQVAIAQEVMKTHHL